MKMSEEKQTEVYNAISDPITELRVYLSRKHFRMGSELFELQLKIWRGVHRALELETPP